MTSSNTKAKPSLSTREWTPKAVDDLVQTYAGQTALQSSAAINTRIEELARRHRQIHDLECFNLNPASNIMNPVAEKMLASGLSTKPSLGYPGDKYEMGLEATEEIEVIAAELCAEIFQARFAEIRIASGAMANLYAFMATCQSGSTIIVPPASIGGHVTHHDAGCAGLFGLQIHEAAINADGYTIDIDKLRAQAHDLKPDLITLGGSLNLFEHPVAKVREIADEVGAKLLFDAAHQCGIIAGRAWSNPLQEGAHMMSMSTYKSLGGPAGGLLVSNDAELMEQIDAIAFPGMTANFDAAKSAALAISMLDWRDHGVAYANTMISTSKALAAALEDASVPVFKTSKGTTESHQFAICADAFDGGQTAAKHLRRAGFLTCGIGLPIDPVAGDLNGLRLGTPEIVRFGMTAEHMPTLAGLIARALNTRTPESMAEETATFRRQFDTLRFINPVSSPGV